MVCGACAVKVCFPGHVCIIKTPQAMPVTPWNAAPVWTTQFCVFSCGISATWRDKNLENELPVNIGFPRYHLVSDSKPACLLCGLTEIAGSLQALLFYFVVNSMMFPK